MSITFKTTLKATGGNTTGIVVPPQVIDTLAAGKKPAVAVTVNGFAFRTSVGVMGGESMIPVSGERRKAAGIAAGDAVAVEIALDTAPRTVDVPDDFAKALSANKAAKAAFEALAPSHKGRHVLAITDAKTPETRARRIEKAIATLLGQ